MQQAVGTPTLSTSKQTTVDYETLGEWFRLLGHPERLRILNILRYDCECVCHMEAILQKPQPYISQQLRVLREAGVVEDQRDGINVFYCLVDDTVRDVLSLVLGPSLPEDKPGDPATCICPKCDG